MISQAIKNIGKNINSSNIDMLKERLERAKNEMENNEASDLNNYFSDLQVVTLNAVDDILSGKTMGEVEKGLLSSIDNLNADKNVVDAHHDYHNHDSKVLNSAKSSSNAGFLGVFSDGSILSSSINSLARGVSNLGVEHFKSSPQSHFEKIGLISNSNDLENDFTLSNNLEMQKDSTIDYGEEQTYGY